MDRPYVICHMLPSIDGRIVLRDWPVPNATREYERTAATFDAGGWIIGRISMEPYAGKARVPARKARTPIARTDFIAEHNATSYAIAIDPSGKLRWTKSDIDGEHVVTILTQSVSDDYLAFLQAQGVSYLFGFGLPNFFFHLTTAYDILRHNGVALSKRDFLRQQG